MMRTIRGKLMLAFFLVNLLVILVVGAIAHYRLVVEVNQIGVEVAFEDFQQDVTSYIRTYGSWEAGQAVEGFGQFERRQRAIATLIGIRPLQAEACLQQAAVSEIELPELQDTDIPITDQIAPSFRFMLVDPAGNHLFGPNQGQPIEPTQGWQDYPITVNGKTVAFAVEDTTVNLNTFDQGYQRLIGRALREGFLVSTGLVLLIGGILAYQFSHPLRQLTAAVEKMRQGQLRQQVPSRSPDEFGVLSRAFNQMSLELAAAYENLEASHQRIQDLSMHDELTQLYNRRYFDAHAAKLLHKSHRYNRVLSIVLGDLDHFKQINDRFSHQVGDRVLQQVANIMQTQVRTSDIVARYGGEEFIMALPETDLERAVQFCDRLRLCIQTYDWEAIQPGLTVTMSLGISADCDLVSLDEMIAIADKKLYQAKAAGRNQVFA